MYIKNIKITNFKAFKEIKFECNSNFNVIIGENNIGKSTLFEALLLWEFTFRKIITSKNHFFKADGKNSYMPFSELSFLRLINDNDLFFESPNICRISLTICAEFNKNFTLTFEISKPKAISNSYLRFKTINHKEFENFSIYLRSKRIPLDKLFFIYQTKPVSNILSHEPFMNKGQILKKISLGKSGEVLRNKIVNKKGINRNSIESQISNVLGYPVNFNCINEKKFETDEFIDLKVNNKDIHLQGSGFLQIAEIFSTVEYLENSINILLIDEPDSHIHSKLQHELMLELKKISKTQMFVISHNDNFVNEINANELFYLNQDSKVKGDIIKLDFTNFDVVKKDLGGTIMALDKLNFCDRICFVEGEDDIKYIEKLKSKISKINPAFTFNNKVTFSFLRGKDNLLAKIEYNKRFLTQLFRDKSYYVVFDKDFSPIDNTDSLKTKLRQKLGNGSRAINHNGYCIESTLFSNANNLIDFLINKYNTNKLATHYFVIEYIQNLEINFGQVTNPLYIQFEEKFKGQQNNTRKELSGVTFNDFIRDTYHTSFKPQFLFNKFLIKDFLENYLKHFNLDFTFEENSAEYYSSMFFNDYIDEITDFNEINVDLIQMMNDIYN